MGGFITAVGYTATTKGFITMKEVVTIIGYTTTREHTETLVRVLSSPTPVTVTCIHLERTSTMFLLDLLKKAGILGSAYIIFSS